MTTGATHCCHWRLATADLVVHGMLMEVHAMTSFFGDLLLSLLMFATGVAIPIMAAWNSRLGIELGSPWAAAFILFVLGVIVCGIAMLALGLPKQGWFS